MRDLNRVLRFIVNYIIVCSNILQHTIRNNVFRNIRLVIEVLSIKHNIVSNVSEPIHFTVYGIRQIYKRNELLAFILYN